MTWQVIETKNVALFIWKTFECYHFIIILSCCNLFSSKWKSISIIVSTSFLLTRRSICWKRNFDASQQTMKLDSFKFDERNCIDESVSSYSRSSANNNRFNRVRLSQTSKMKRLRSRVFQIFLIVFVVWIYHVIVWHHRFFSTFLFAVRKIEAHFKI